jgi:diguanylate cyclase (GGDEF)-like protein/PAS domain S-box-containing protein
MMCAHHDGKPQRPGVAGAPLGQAKPADPNGPFPARVLESFKARIAILDLDGQIVQTNAAWRTYEQGGAVLGSAMALGTNFLAFCDHAAAEGNAEAAFAATGVRAILAGDQDDYAAMFECPRTREQRWCCMQVSRLAGIGVRAGLLLSYNDVSQRTPAEAALVDAQQLSDALTAAAKEKLRFVTNIAEHLPGMVGYWDRRLLCRFANHGYLEWFGKSPETMLGISMQALMGTTLFALNEPYVRRVLAGESLHFERTLTKADGSTGYTLANYIPDIDPGGAVAGFFVLVSDITPMKKVEFELKLADSVYQNSLDGIFVTDADGVILSVNPAFTLITGFSAEEVIGANPRILKSNQHGPDFYAAMWGDLAASGQWQGEIWNRRKNGDLFLEWQKIKRIPGSGDRPTRYLSVFSDQTELWRKSERIKHLAFFDALTDLPNRALFMDRLEHTLTAARRAQRVLAVMFLDLDGFKVVNDTLGHDMGDALLKTVASVLLAQVRDSDTVARLGGDEFVILLAALADRDEVDIIARRIIQAIHQPIMIGTDLVQIGVSIGIAMYPADAPTPFELIKTADTAMYEAKHAGRNTYRFASGS